MPTLPTPWCQADQCSSEATEQRDTLCFFHSRRGRPHDKDASGSGGGGSDGPDGWNTEGSGDEDDAGDVDVAPERIRKRAFQLVYGRATTRRQRRRLREVRSLRAALSTARRSQATTEAAVGVLLEQAEANNAMMEMQAFRLCRMYALSQAWQETIERLWDAFQALAQGIRSGEDHQALIERIDEADKAYATIAKTPLDVELRQDFLGRSEDKPMFT